MAELAAETASRGRLLARRRLAWFAAAVAVLALMTTYVFLAVVAHPLVAGNAEGVNGGVLQQDINSNPGTQIRVLDYVDGQGAVILHILLSNCEYSAGGGMAGLSSIRVHYSVLGTPRVEDIPLFNSVWVKVPDTCPRIAPATPSP